MGVERLGRVWHATSTWGICTGWQPSVLRARAGLTTNFAMDRGHKAEIDATNNSKYLMCRSELPAASTLTLLSGVKKKPRAQNTSDAATKRALRRLRTEGRLQEQVERAHEWYSAAIADMYTRGGNVMYYDTGQHRARAPRRPRVEQEQEMLG
jgi:hypothetical protein